MRAYAKNDLVDRYSKYVKTVSNRVVEVEFYWFQFNPRQIYRLRVNEQQFNEAQKCVRTKKLLNLKFEQFVDLVTPIFANGAISISDIVLRSTFDNLFDQNSNGKVEPEELEALYTLLQGPNTNKKSLLQENLRQIFNNRTKYITFKEFSEYVKCGYLRHVFMS